MRVPDAAELKRMRSRWSDGMALTEMVKLHHFDQRVIRSFCEGCFRPEKPPKMKRQAPHGLSRDFD